MKLQDAVYCHEHIGLNLATPERPDRILDDKEALIKELKTLKQSGITKIVNLTNMGMGRNLDFIKSVSAATLLKVTIATGYYKEPFFPKEVYTLSEEELAKKISNEIIKGIDNTEVKATVIGEIGSSLNKITEAETKAFKAAARSQIATKVPLVTHTTLGTMALEQIELFKSFKLDLSRVVISHMDLNHDFDYIVKVLDSGVNIGFDTIGKIKYHADTTRAEFLIELCKRGYQKQILLSEDLTTNAQLKKYYGIGYNYLLSDFVPFLLENGLAENDLRIMLEANPNRIFKGSFTNA